MSQTCSKWGDSSGVACMAEMAEVPGFQQVGLLLPPLDTKA